MKTKPMQIVLSDHLPEQQFQFQKNGGSSSTLSALPLSSEEKAEIPVSRKNQAPMMLRRPALLLIRRFCTTHTKPPSAANATFTSLMKADWVDSDDRLASLIATADQLITSYRANYDPSAPDEVTLKEHERLYIAKEAANASDALGDYVEVLIRKHEDMLGALGDNTEIPANEADETIQLLEDYVRMVNEIEDKEIRRKFEMELGRKMVVLRQVLSVHDFSNRLAPIAGDHIVTRTKRE